MKIAVIADDLTGANATGVRLSEAGLSTATILEDLSNFPMNHYDAICVNTDSRYVSKEIASNRVFHMTKLMKDKGVEVICKRIDSTVRGNIGSEIDAILNCLGENAVAVVVPSFPQSGRAMAGGYLLVNGILVQESEVAKDPVSPLKRSYVPHIIKEQSKRRVSLINIETVLHSEEFLRNSLLELIHDGVQIIVIDAINQDHIERIANAMNQLPFLLIPVDPGPLSSAYAEKKVKHLLEEPRLLIVVGSAATLTASQVKACTQAYNITPVYVNPLELVQTKERREKEKIRAIKEGVKKTKDNQLILITTVQSDENQLIDLKAIATVQKTTEDHLAKQITDSLADITLEVYKNSYSAINGCFSSGGDVTASLCLAANTHGLELIGEVVPLAAYGRFIGGVLDGIPVVTKGGLVGNKETLKECVEFLIKKVKKQQVICE